VSAAPALADYRVNDFKPFCETGTEAALLVMEQAIALLAAIKVDPDEYHQLNARIQWRALEGIETLIALAHYRLQEGRRLGAGRSRPAGTTLKKTSCFFP
jgi:hypothetical protein